MSGTSLASSHKDKARGAVKEAFDVLKNNVTSKTPKSASVILEKFNKVMIGLRKVGKKDEKEPILGKYLDGENIKGADKSPIFKAVKDFLFGENTVFENRAFVKSDNNIDGAISSMQSNVAKKLGKCKRLKSADVLAAMYHVGYSTIKQHVEPVLGLLILGEMFTELGKKNGFIKGNSEGVAEDNPQNIKTTDETTDKKDNANKHLGTLATQELRNLAATIGKKIRGLMESAEWLKKEMGNTINYAEESTKVSTKDHDEDNPNQEQTMDSQQPAMNMRAELINHMRQKNIAKLADDHKNDPAIRQGLKLRGHEEGKILTRDVATDEELLEFLESRGSMKWINTLKVCCDNEDEFTAQLNSTYPLRGKKISLRAILNGIATIATYHGNTLEAVVKKLPADGDAMDTLLQMVEAKLKRSNEKDPTRKETNLKLKNWITVIQVVIACAKPVTMDYSKDKTYEGMLTELPKKLNGISVEVLTEKGVTLETKEIQALTKVDIDEGKELPDLNQDYEKRLRKLGIEYNANLDYKNLYKKIYAFIENPGKQSLEETGIEIKTTDAKPITEKNWAKSNDFDAFVDKYANAISKIAIEYQQQPDLPPVNGKTRDGRLVLSDDANAFANFKAENDWLDKPTQQDCDNAIKDITVEEYLGENINLLKALKGEGGNQYVLGIKLADFVESWTDLALEKLGKNILEKNKNFTDDTGEQTINLENGLAVSARLAQAKETGYKIEEVNAFVEFVSQNSSKDFCNVAGITDEANWGNLMTGKSSFIIALPDDKENGKAVGIDVKNENKFEYVYGQIEKEKPTNQNEETKNQSDQTAAQGDENMNGPADGSSIDEAGKGGTNGNNPTPVQHHVENTGDQNQNIPPIDPPGSTGNNGKSGTTINTNIQQTGKEKDPTKQCKQILKKITTLKEKITNSLSNLDNTCQEIKIGALKVWYKIVEDSTNNDHLTINELNDLTRVIGECTSDGSLGKTSLKEHTGLQLTLLKILNGMQALKVKQ